MFSLSLREETDSAFGSLTIHTRSMHSFTPSEVLISGDKQTRRSEIEAFIQAVYADSYGASIAVHYPTLMSIQDKDGTILAALGLRDAADGRLFLEHYLDMPVEQHVGALGKTPPTRAQIVEVGNLASRSKGAAQYLYLAFHAYAFELGYRYVTVTATAALALSFRRMQLECTPLAPALPARVPGYGIGWGSYYESRPHVYAGDISQGLQTLLIHYGAEYLHAHTPLRVKLHPGKGPRYV